MSKKTAFKKKVRQVISVKQLYIVAAKWKKYRYRFAKYFVHLEQKQLIGKVNTKTVCIRNQGQFCKVFKELS